MKYGLMFDEDKHIVYGNKNFRVGNLPGLNEPWSEKTKASLLLRRNIKRKKMYPGHLHTIPS